MTRMIRIAAILIAGFFLWVGVGPTEAWAASLYLSPSSGTFGVGDTMTVAVRVNTGGEAVNAVSAVVSYPADLLTFSWIGEGGILSIWAQKSGGGGVVTMAGGKIGSFSGDGQVGTIAFGVNKAGTATLSFQAGHIVTASGNRDVYSGGAAGAYTLVPGSVGGSALSGVGTSSSQIATPSPVILTNIFASSVSSTSEEISWETDRLADSTIEYGIETGKYLMSASKGERSLTHKIKLVGLTPDTTFYLLAKSVDSSGVVGISGEVKFKTSPAVVAKANQNGLLILILGALVLAGVTVGLSIWFLRRRRGRLMGNGQVMTPTTSTQGVSRGGV